MSIASKERENAYLLKILYAYFRLPKNVGDVAQLKLSDGSELDTLLVVGADGARSGVRRAMRVESTGWSYNQKAIVATLAVETFGGTNSIAWQRFTPLGPIALLPLTRELSSLVWTTTNADAERLMMMPADRFVDELNHYLVRMLKISSQNIGLKSPILVLKCSAK